MYRFLEKNTTVTRGIREQKMMPPEGWLALTIRRYQKQKDGCPEAGLH